MPKEDGEPAGIRAKVAAVRQVNGLLVVIRRPDDLRLCESTIESLVEAVVHHLL